ncbi:MAG: lamin tail domain-containing protein, partial [Bacteroidota bacterium]
MRFIFLATLFSLWFPLLGQVQDDFSDGDFSQNPTWNGEPSLFQISADFQLQSNGPAASDTLHLATDNSLIDSAEWRFRITYASAPSGSNRIRVYLVSDQANLEGPLNGYFLAVGEGGSNDSYDLYRQDGDNLSLLIDGLDSLAGSEIDARIRVRRDQLGNWSLEVDPGNTGMFQAQGVIQDLTHTTTSSIGVWIKHTSTRADDFFFDDFYVGPYQIDNQPPVIDSVEVLGSNQLQLVMSEEVTESSAEEDLHYLLLPPSQVPSQVTRSEVNPAEVILDWQVAFQDNQTYQLVVNQLVDFSGNVMSNPDTIAFAVDLPDVAIPKDVIFNEIMADPSPVVGLPEAEYIEILNRSTKSFDLMGWTLEDNTASISLPAYSLGPGEMVALTREADAPLLQGFGPSLGIPGFPTLTNAGEPLALVSPLGLIVDSLQYRSDWYGDPEKDNGGYSLELIRPNQLTCPDAPNWIASIAVEGGTPGTQNSVFDPNPDTQAPLVQSVNLLGTQQLEICFDQSMDEASLVILSNYFLSAGLGNPNIVQVIEPDAACIQLGWGSSIPVGISLTLEISNLLDCQGNVFQDTSLQVARGVAPQAFEVIINECLFDINPVVGLPEAEFVELFNRSTQILDLTGYLFADASGSVSLPSETLFPGEYVIICDEDDQAAFEAFGKVWKVDGLPNLNSDTDSLRLTGPNGELVDYVFYEDEWITEEEKTQGGWSLERIDPNLLDCNQPANWGASNDP